MKKILAVILVLALAAALPLTAMAQIDLVNENIAITVDKAAVAPVIDGKLDADSYGKIAATVNDFLVYGGDDEYDAWMSANLPDAYISYDANNVYIFLSGDATHYSSDHTIDTAGDIWNQSCIQISLATADAEGTDRLEIGLTRNSETGEQVPNIWAQGSDSNGKDEYTMVQGQNFAIALDGGRLNYEVSIPWTTFLPAAPKAGEAFGLNFIYGWYPDVRMGVEYSAGCCNGKDASLFSKVTLTENVLQAAPVVVDEPVADKVAEDEAAAPEAAVVAPAAPAAVRTGDTGMIILISIIVIAAIGVVILRKKTAK